VLHDENNEVGDTRCYQSLPHAESSLRPQSSEEALAQGSIKGSDHRRQRVSKLCFRTTMRRFIFRIVTYPRLC